MKLGFSTLDIIAILPELKAKICTGWRVNQIYDSDYKTYIFKLNKSIVQMKKDNDKLDVNEVTENKMSFIIESGLRIHTTDYNWPRVPAPGQFATKLRKHLRNKRVEDIRQVGIDRVVVIQFGTQNLANHLIIELYDRGNLILTDSNYVIIAVLRWRKPGLEQKQQSNKKNDEDEDKPADQPEELEDGFKVGQLYPIDKCKKMDDIIQMDEDQICEILNAPQTMYSNTTAFKKSQKQKQDKDDRTREIDLKSSFNRFVIYGSSLLEDKLLKYMAEEGIRKNKSVVKIDVGDDGKLNQDQVRKYAAIVKKAFNEADNIIEEVQETGKSKGYLVQKKQTNSSLPPVAMIGSKDNNKKVNDSKKQDDKKELITNLDFFPILSCAERKIQQGANQGLAIQEYESFDQCVDVYYTNLTAQKIDAKTFSAEKEARKKLVNLKISQEKRLEELGKSQIEDEVKGRLIELNSVQVDQALLIIRSMIANQMSWSDISSMIKQAQQSKDPIASLITGVKFDRNQFAMRLQNPYDDDDDSTRPKIVDIDIDLSAHANARKYFDLRRHAVDKKRKTIEVSKKAYKNVERKTKEMLKEVVVKSSITKARKRFWFENFSWFISSEGYLVVAGRDAAENDLLVKRYMKNNDIYVHGDLHGASSVIIKNESNNPIPPKTLNEAGTFAVCNSSAWEAKIVQTSWWVYPHQVSKSAPTGEYLTSGAFIIRGKKNYLPISNLVMGFGFLFRLGEESIEKRKSARLAKEALYAKLESESSHDTTVSPDKQNEDQPEEDDNSIASDESQDTLSNEDQDAGEDKAQNVDDKQDNPTDVADDDNDVEPDDEDDDDKQGDHRLIDTLTEFPQPDDILLYAIPMCGPYNAFQSFKYKVKVIPGVNKRGKAAKTALGMFMHDKRASQREKDLLRVLKDQDYARNLPNKVKISAPNLNRDRNKNK